ncbi:MAG: ankyrin repeat domain-containing protein [Nitrospinales bacterium]
MNQKISELKTKKSPISKNFIFFLSCLSIFLLEIAIPGQLFAEEKFGKIKELIESFPKPNLKRTVYSYSESLQAMDMAMAVNHSPLNILYFYKLINKAKERDPKLRAPEDYLLLAVRARYNKKYQKAAQLARQGLDLKVAAFYLKPILEAVEVLALNDSGNKEALSSFITRLAKDDPDQLLDFLYKFLNSLKYSSEAERGFTLLLARYGEKSWIYKNRANYYRDMKWDEKAESDYFQAIHLAPGEKEPLQDLSLFYVKAKNYEKAENIILNLILKDPNRIEGYKRLAMIYNSKNDFKKEEEQYKHILNLDPNNLDALTSLIIIYSKNKDFSKSEEIIKTIIKLDSDQKANPAYLHSQLAEIYHKQKKYDKAIETYEYVAKLKPDNNSTLKTLNELRNYRDYLNAIQLNPDSIKARKNIIEYWFFKGVMQDEMNSMAEETVKLFPDSWQAHYLFGRTLERRKRNKEAGVHYLKALELNPDSAKVRYGAGNMYSYQGEFNQAMKEYKLAKKMDPNINLKYDDGYSKSISAIADGLEEEIQKLVVQSKAEPKNANICLEIAKYYNRRVWNFDIANKWINKALQIDTNFAAAYFELALNLKYQGKETESKKVFEQGHLKAPEHLNLLRTVARLAFEEKYYLKALKYNKKLLKRDPDDPQGLMGSAACYEKLGKYDLQISQLEKLISLPSMQNDTQSKYKFENFIFEAKIKLNKKTFKDSFLHIPVSLHNYMRVPDDSSWSPLHIAAAEGNLQKVQKLVEDGVIVDIKNQDNATPLCVAAKRGRLDVVRYLIEKGADVNAKESLNGFTAMHHAAGYHHEDVLRYLLNHGANVNAKNNLGQTPLMQVALQDWHADFKMANILIARGADINAQSKTGCSPLLCAVARGNNKLAKLLIEKGAEVNFSSPQGFTPLYMAVENEDLPMALTLYKKGANPNAPYRGTSPLQKAISIGLNKMVSAFTSTPPM